jgi:hypothetical protein
MDLDRRGFEKDDWARSVLEYQLCGVRILSNLDDP